ncbi:MAG TPA: helix-turn-helix transcriptional regulator [Candidatus Avipropionibacterium avicola]|uniref:Helix-turn-helix transcriptional regulator n=1 Tax=Candidatus Avipropionibacterium avicola TaxID=2840701 RepID=A0A9D1H0D5_9ACTN|nr:helix-turn-helix transcriptional regulator [Candidatus Avipropionibacterium avicola]
MSGFAKDQWESVGEFIAQRRRAAELSLRQLAERAGVSNPYLSQIERGLRKPSAEVLQQVAKALQVSAETLYVRAGILDPDEDPHTSFEHVVSADPRLTERQRTILLDLYASFVEPLDPSPQNGTTQSGTTQDDPTQDDTTEEKS